MVGNAASPSVLRDAGIERRRPADRRHPVRPDQPVRLPHRHRRVQRADPHRPAARPRLRRAPGAARREQLRGGLQHLPGAGGHRVPGAAAGLSRRLAGASVRRRHRQPGGGAGATRRPAGRTSRSTPCASICRPASMRASWQSSATFSRSPSMATRSSGPATRCSCWRASEHIRQVIVELRRMENPVRNVMIAGGGNIGYAFRQGDRSELPGQTDRTQRGARRATGGAPRPRPGAARRRHRRKAAGAGEHRRHGHVPRPDQRRRGQHHGGADGQAAGRQAGAGADQPPGLCRPGAGRRRSTSPFRRPSCRSARCSPTCATATSPACIRLRRGAAEALELVAHGDEKTSKVVGRRIEDIELPEGATSAPSCARRIPRWWSTKRGCRSKRSCTRWSSPTTTP